MTTGFFERRCRPLRPWTMGLVLALAPALARAQSDANMSLAYSLFEEGQRLMADKKYPEACAKFAESYRLSNGTGALINLASCEEARGRSATALAHYKAALVAARREQREDRARFSEERIASLEQQVSRVRLLLAEGADIEGLEVRLDGYRLTPAALNVPTPLDPGVHIVVATAPARRRWVQQLQVADQPGETTVTIPVLEADDSVAPSGANPTAPAPPAPAAHTSPAPSPVLPPPAPAAEADTSSSYFTAPIVIAGSLTLAVGAGAALTGLQYLAKRDDFDGANAALSDDRHDLHDEARTLGWVSLGLTGAAVVGAGVTTFLIVQRANARSPARGTLVAPWVTAAAGGLVVGGHL